MSMFRHSFTVNDEPSKTGRWMRKKHGRHSRHGKLKAQSRSDSLTERPVSSPAVTFVVSSERRFFVGHEHVIAGSPYFRSILRDLSTVGAHANKVVELPDEDPEIFSCILEYLYKGDYYPRLTHNELENAHDAKTFDRITSKATILHARTRDEILRDTVVYCAAEKYGLQDLKQLALRKQGLHVGIPIPIILRSARYAYENTPDSDADLRAHYLVMVIRAREMFKTSGTMEMEMEKGHAWFFDLFVAMCNHIDDMEGFCKQQTFKSS